MAAINLLAPWLAAILCMSCSAELSPLDISVGSITRQRPETTVGPAIKGLTAEWRVVRISLPSSQIRAAESFNSTVHLQLNDCGGVTIAIDDIYVSNFSLNEMSAFPADEFKRLIGSANSVAAIFYIREDLFQRERRICGFISGGGMAVGQTGGVQFVVK